jgi:hypothetical protein
MAIIDFVYLLIIVKSVYTLGFAASFYLRDLFHNLINDLLIYGLLLIIPLYPKIVFTALSAELKLIINFIRELLLILS